MNITKRGNAFLFESIESFQSCKPVQFTCTISLTTDNTLTNQSTSNSIRFKITNKHQTNQPTTVSKPHSNSFAQQILPLNTFKHIQQNITHSNILHHPTYHFLTHRCCHCSSHKVCTNIKKARHFALFFSTLPNFYSLFLTRPLPRPSTWKITDSAFSLFSRR